jgi:hypothetical protein
MTSDPREQAAIDLKIARADAIHRYSAVENTLCTLFTRMLGTTDELGGLVFYRIIAARSRNEIIEDLIKKRIDPKYTPYWFGIPGSSGVPKQTGLMALIRQLDTMRNFIVHWAVAVNVGAGAPTESLIPPNFWNIRNDRRSLTVADLADFSARALFVSKSIMAFQMQVFPPLAKKDEMPSPWPEIFQQPCTYPPLSTHPLFQKR